MSEIFQYKRLLLLAAAVCFLDQATKLWVAAVLPYETFFLPDAIEVFPGIFNIVHVGNTGAAWSLFSGYSWALAIVGFAALAVVFAFRRALELEKPRMQWAFGFIVGGVVGNLIDRVRLGYVVDFLDFHYEDYYFPSFNVADSGITVGVSLYILFSFLPQRGGQPEAAPPEELERSQNADTPDEPAVKNDRA